MKIKKYLMLIFIISIAYFISSETYADEINDSTQVEAELISKETDDEIYKNKELDEIGSIYCPPDPTWSRKVREIMWEIWKWMKK